MVFLAAGPQRESNICDKMVYANSNQLDYELQLPVIRGVVQDVQDLRIPGACVGVFTEPDRRLVATSETDDEGRFWIEGVTEGRYRLVVRFQPFCTANALVRVAGKSTPKEGAVVHMRVRGLDDCSDIDVIR
jgi:hypothetical protein